MSHPYLKDLNHEPSSPSYSPQFLRRQSQAPVLSLARRKYPRPSLHDLESAISAPSSVSFVIVRHPFERLLSAYRDKIYNSLPNTIHRALSSAILRKYRPLAATKSTSRRATFEEFVLYLLDTFRSNETGLDMHWAPVVQFCTPCLINFNVILKFETLQEDQRYLIELTGLSHLIKPEWINEGKGGSTNQMIGKFYSELSADQLYQLYNVYK
ncbi:carbohydrate sulfotransferase 11-like [Diaphorina citri]|uniref:Carbohydrate sulfotransferase n=1 Tax=Diaphorina citri TaxID=121845 RepID=A0A1S3DAK5_DIACI|nr:carbohydrate sulfotransferase 11-like [Diaphorina citri]